MLFVLYLLMMDIDSGTLETYTHHVVFTAYTFWKIADAQVHWLIMYRHSGDHGFLTAHAKKIKIIGNYW